MANGLASSRINDISIIHAGKKYTFKVNAAEIGYWARCQEVPEAITQAKTLDELADNMKDVLTLALRPIPSKIKKENQERATGVR